MKQTVIILSNIQIDLRRSMSDVPNQDGFRLLGILPNKIAIPIQVKKDANACHYLADQFNSYRLPSIFIGWVPDTATR